MIFKIEFYRFCVVAKELHIPLQTFVLNKRNVLSYVVDIFFPEKAQQN